MVRLLLLLLLSNAWLLYQNILTRALLFHSTASELEDVWWILHDIVVCIFSYIYVGGCVCGLCLWIWMYVRISCITCIPWRIVAYNGINCVTCVTYQDCIAHLLISRIYHDSYIPTIYHPPQTHLIQASLYHIISYHKTVYALLFPLHRELKNVWQILHDIVVCIDKKLNRRLRFWWLWIWIWLEIEQQWIALDIVACHCI